MAILAGVCRGNVGGVLACGRGAIVAAGTIPGHGTVIEESGRPGVGAVAVVAGIAAGYMVCRFPPGRGSIMAAGAGLSDIGMIKTCAAPAGGGVAVITSAATAYVRDWLAIGDCTVVTS